MAMQRFEAHQVASVAAQHALKLAFAKAPPAIRSLCDQMIRATTSVPLNLAEGSGRRGKDRRYHFSVAYGSAQEASSALELLASTGTVSAEQAELMLALLDRVKAMTWRLMQS